GEPEQIGRCEQGHAGEVVDDAVDVGWDHLEHRVCLEVVARQLSAATLERCMGITVPAEPRNGPTTRSRDRPNSWPANVLASADGARTRSAATSIGKKMNLPEGTMTALYGA